MAFLIVLLAMLIGLVVCALLATFQIMRVLACAMVTLCLFALIG
ncbi:MAG: hypothetical protein SOI38_02845 [Eggerthellaceae bacterium]|jgi:hypothetical protein